MGKGRKSGLSYFVVALLAVLLLVAFTSKQAVASEPATGNIYIGEVKPLTIHTRYLGYRHEEDDQQEHDVDHRRHVHPNLCCCSAFR